MLTTLLKSIDTFVIRGSTSSSIKLLLTKIGLIVIPISTGIACGVTVNEKVIHEIVKVNTKNFMRKINKQLNLLIDSIERYYKTMLSIKANIIPQVILLPSSWLKQKLNLFMNMHKKLKLNLSSNDNLEINLDPRTRIVRF